MALKNGNVVVPHLGDRLMTPAQLAVDRDGEADRRDAVPADDLVRIGRADANGLADGLCVGCVAHEPLSQIVTLKASAKCHSLCGDPAMQPWHIVTMDDQSKNGGPNHLRAWREYRKLTQAELASEVGTNANMIGYLESGERGLSAKWLRRLADALKITPGHLLDHDPSSLPTDILEIWMNADPGQRRQLAEVAKALVRTGTDG